MTSPSRVSALAIVVATAALTTCRARDTTAPPVPTRIARVSTERQAGQAGQPLPQPLVVAVTTASGAGAAGVSVTWTITAGSGSLSAPFTTTDDQGHASVQLTLGPIAGSDIDTVTATATGLAGSPVSFVVSASAGPAATLTLVSGDDQTATVGDTLAARLRVVARDQFGNGATGVAVGWSVIAGGGSVSSASVSTDEQGIAAVAWTLGHGAGTKNDTVTASAPGLIGSPVTFTASAAPAPATQLVRVSGDNQVDTVGRALPDSLVVETRDQFANAVAGVVVTWTITAGGGALSAGSGVTDPQGRTATAWTLGDSVGTQHATASLPGSSTAVFSATALALPSNHLQFAVQPSQVEAGSVISPHVQVTVLDGSGNPATGFTDSVTVALGANPGGATLSGTLQVAVVSGVASFDDLTLEKAGSGYTLVVSAPALAPVTSSPFDVSPGTATQLAFTAQPASTTAGSPLSSIQLTARDAFGNTAQSFGGDVAVLLGNNPGGATLSGTTTVAATNGIATFTDLSLDKAGTGYALTATAGSLTGATSTPFDIMPGAASQLVFTVQPTSAETSAVITPAVEVTAQDAYGNTATDFAETVAVTIGTNPAGGTLGGTTAIPAVAGVATFADLRIDKSGAGYTLQASAGSLTGSSAPFDITLPPPAGSVAIAAGDAQMGLAGYPLNVAPTVLVLDASNAPLVGASVTFTVASGGGSVTSATTTTDANGIAAVGGWSVQLGSNTLTATVAAAGITGNPVTFTATGVASAYHIDVRFLTPMTPSRQAAFTDAAAKWETLIYGDVPDVVVNAPAGACGSNSPALHETIDDIVIFATVDSIDGPGKILGQAGPCGFRGSGLPFLGTMMFDSADVAQLEADGQFGTVILHEMGHVLGYGTIWSALGVLAGAGGSDPHFTGPQAIAAFDRSGGQNYSAGAKVPVENCVGFPAGTCGAGTRDSHWRESVFDNELMTGFLNGGVANPLSVNTTASMGDLGYTVNYAGSDPYAVANPLAALRAPGGVLMELRDDILSIPRFTVDRAGRIRRIATPE